MERFVMKKDPSLFSCLNVVLMGFWNDSVADVVGTLCGSPLMAQCTQCLATAGLVANPSHLDPSLEDSALLESSSVTWR